MRGGCWAGGRFAGLAVRPFRSRDRLEVRVLHHGQVPLSAVEKAFVQAFDDVWREGL